MRATGILIGFGVGYVLGAKAGRERYEELVTLWHQVSRTPLLSELLHTGASTLERGIEAGREIVRTGLAQAGQEVRRLAETGQPAPQG